METKEAEYLINFIKPNKGFWTPKRCIDYNEVKIIIIQILHMRLNVRNHK